MWGNYINEDYIIVAPENYAGILDFNKKPEMMIQFDFKEVKDADEFDESLPIKYKNLDNYIERYNREKFNSEKTQEEKVLAERDVYLSMFQGSREGTNIPDKSSNGSFVSLENEEKALKSYKEYLENIESNPNFPNIQVLSFSEWLRVVKSALDEK